MNVPKWYEQKNGGFGEGASEAALALSYPEKTKHPGVKPVMTALIGFI